MSSIDTLVVILFEKVTRSEILCSHSCCSLGEELIIGTGVSLAFLISSKFEINSGAFSKLRTEALIRTTKELKNDIDVFPKRPFTLSAREAAISSTLLTVFFFQPQFPPNIIILICRKQFWWICPK